MTNLSQADMDNILHTLTDRILTGADFAQFRGPQGGQEQSTPGLQIIDTRWRIEEFGLFQPDLQVDERNPPGDVITVGKDSIYRNVDAFCERIKDAYPLPRPEDVTGRVKGKYYVALVDLQKSFYQLWLAIMDRWKTTTLTHRGLQSWNVVPTGATGSPPHMQRFMDKILEEHEEYAKSYVDDVLIFSDDFDSHI
jgi:Reverse transcriptase (RNA-dependent DNA polymerase)